MGELIKQVSVTLLATTVAQAGGRKTDAKFMAIYGGAYCASSFIKWVVPAFTKVDQWFDKIGTMIDKAGSIIPWVTNILPF